MLITISRTLETDIMNFVRLNKIENINDFLSNCLRDGFNIAKYGFSPKDNFEKENKPFKIESHESEDNITRLETSEKKKSGRPRKEQAKKEESVIHEEKNDEIVKPKKKIIIIKD